MNRSKIFFLIFFSTVILGVILLNDVVWAQNTGMWQGSSDEGGELYFYVKDGKVENFSILANLSGGSAGSGWLWLGIEPAMPISGNSFGFNGTYFDVSGTFSSSTTCYGTYDYQDSYLGYSSGTWTAEYYTDPYIKLLPPAHNFNQQTIYTVSSVATFTLSNEGGGTGTGTISLTGTDADQFEITGGGGGFSLSPGESKTVFVQFVPTLAGWKSATLTVDGDSPSNDVSASVMGLGLNPMSLSVVPDYHIVLNEADFETFAVTNAGDGSMAWTAVSDPDDTWLSITGGDNGTNSGTITVSYEANDGDARMGFITVTADGSLNSPQTVKLFQAEGRPVWKLTADDGAEYDYFGEAVSISGNFAVVGAYGDDDKGNYSGSAYVFEQTESGWVKRAKLTASDGSSGDYFGRAVSISGDYIIVGAYGDSSYGSAYIFRKPSDGWQDMTETAKLTASDKALSDSFGLAVSISLNHAIVGAYGGDDSGDNSGSAYIFEMPPDGWQDMTETAKLTASDGAAGDNFGRAVDIFGDTVIVGAKYHDSDNSDDSGSAYIFEMPTDGWMDMTETAKLTARDGAQWDYFGLSVSISGDQAIVGAYGDDDNGSYSGSAYVFEQVGSIWLQKAKLTASDGAASDYFGASVGISGDMAIVGAYNQGLSSSGSAYIFKKPVDGWIDMTETSKRTTSGYYGPESFGLSVGISGDFAIVGDGKYNATNSYDAGAAYIYAVSNLSLAISKIVDQSIFENSTLNEISFTIFDSETPADNLSLSGSSSNNTLVPTENIVFGGTDVDRTVTVTPAPNSSGTATITVRLSDDSDMVDESFLLTVIALPDLDEDGLPDCYEDINGNGIVDPGETDPSNPDSDNDGLNDGIEVNILATNPLSADSDGNGILDGEENNDGDRFTNIEEVQCGSDPGDPNSRCSSGLPWLMLLLD
jgi:FG-GAP repeat/Putative binding domain, N-terminal